LVERAILRSREREEEKEEEEERMREKRFREIFFIIGREGKLNKIMPKNYSTSPYRAICRTSL